MPPQAWYADDAQAGGKLLSLRAWWGRIILSGPGFGYHPNASKTFLIVKPGMLAQANDIFAGTGVNIQAGGHRDLGAAIGSNDYITEFLKGKVEKWVSELDILSDIANTQPHAAHAYFVHAQQSKWTYAQRTMKQISHLLQPLEDVIRRKFIPALFGNGHQISDIDRRLYALPGKCGGLALVNPVLDAPIKHDASLRLTETLTSSILASRKELSVTHSEILKIKKELATEKKARLELEMSQVRACLPLRGKAALDFGRQKGASTLITALPLKRYGLTLQAKRDFRDYLLLKFAKPVPGLNVMCACGQKYSVDHSQVCKKGGFIHMRHDEPAQLFGFLCTKVFKDVELEPHLEPLSGESFELKSAKTEDGARSDVRVRGFWRKGQSAFFDFRIFYPFARSYLGSSPNAQFTSHSKAKKREYEQRINQVDAGSFTPMVMSSTGSAGPEMDIALKHLASCLAEKNNENYSHVLGNLRARFAFCMIRSALVCLRGSRSLRKSSLVAKESWDTPADVVVHEIRDPVL